MPPTFGDATAALNRALDEHQSVLVNLPLVVNGTVTPPPGATLTMVADGAFVRSADAPRERFRPVILIVADDVTLVDVVVRGPNPCYWSLFR